MVSTSGSSAARVRAALVAAVVAAFVLVLPTLVASPDTSLLGSSVVTLSLAALGLALLVRHGTQVAALAGRTPAFAPSSRDEPPPVLTGRVTDPVHHPLRPRAPGAA